jgi:hypothetical protein
MRWAGHVARIGERRNEYRILVGKLEGRRPLEKPRRRCVNNIKMKKAVFWDVAPCRYCVNRRFGGTYRFASIFRIEGKKKSVSEPA